MVKKIDHLGIAVYSIAEARTFYEKVLGLSCERIEEVTSQQVRTAFFPVGDTHIELLEPTTPESPIARFLARHGEGLHHIGYQSNDLEAQLDRARENGCPPLTDVPVEGAGGKRIAFLHPKSAHGVLTELCEPGKL
jgi:methylmalonyl-CoA/ethylmalonyl-CoA epimerase